MGAFSGNHESLYEIVNENNEKYTPAKVVASLLQLLTMCRWADVSRSGALSSSECQGQQLLPLNLKQWLVTIVNDCFFFLMNKNQPILAFVCLKIAESYFCQMNDPNEYYIIKDLQHVIQSKSKPGEE